LDRRALPAPDESTTAAARAFVAPRTPVEEVLAGIWAQVLRVERVGVHDNFFELGGHSLLATRLIAQVRDAFELNLYLAAIFEAPTVARLAELVETTHWAAQGAAPLAESREGEREEGEL
jgi:acyl carrier protein